MFQRIFALLVLITFGGTARAAVTTYTSFNQWSQAVQSHTTLDFTGFAFGTIITTQYSHLGATFTDGDDNVVGPTFTYPQDMWGLRGQNGGAGDIDITFDTPQYAIGAHFPGMVQFFLFLDGALVHTTGFGGGGGTNFFFGLSGDVAFDAVKIIDPLDKAVFIDNIYFAVPSPGAIGVFAMAVMMGGGRRRWE